MLRSANHKTLGSERKIAGGQSKIHSSFRLPQHTVGPGSPIVGRHHHRFTLNEVVPIQSMRKKWWGDHALKLSAPEVRRGIWHQGGEDQSSNDKTRQRH